MNLKMDPDREITLKDIFILSRNNHDEYNLIKNWYSTRNWLSELRSLEHQKKCDWEAEFAKDDGNIFYELQEFSTAMLLYIQALLFANKNSSMYGTILANISSCLYERHLFKKCVIFIDACLSTSYPKTSRPKLYVRKIKALSTSGQKVCAAKANSDFKKFMKKCKLSSADKEKYFKLAKEALKVTEVLDADGLGDYLLPAFNENPKILNVTISAELKYDEQNGRHILAQAPIKKGECVLMEKPYASVGYSRCPNCFKYIKNIVTCEQCPGIMYCSNVCREQDNDVHRWECKFYQLETFRELDSNILLAFRVFLKGLLGGYKYNPNKIEEELQFGDKTDNFPYVQQMYGNFSEIVIDKRVLYLDGCCVLLACINMDKKLRDWIGKEIGTNLYLTGKFLLQLIANCNMNARYEEDTDGLFCNQLYPSQSLFNHSCVPNVTLRFQEDRIVMMTLKDINPGEQIYTNYIMAEMETMTAEDRKEVLLKDFSFSCDCELCRTNSVMKGLLQCPKCKCYADMDDDQIDCRTCKTRTKLSCDQILKMKTLGDAVEIYEFNQDVNILYEGIQIAHELKLHPSSYIMVGTCIKYIVECIKSGQLDQSAKYLQYTQDIERTICTTSTALIFAELKMMVKKMCSSNEWAIPKYKKSTLIEYEKHLVFVHYFASVYYPVESVLTDLKNIQEFFIMQKRITEFRESFDWIH